MKICMIWLIKLKKCMWFEGEIITSRNDWYTLFLSAHIWGKLGSLDENRVQMTSVIVKKIILLGGNAWKI